jgi:putative aldouronate transport system substrate-binding protein
MATDTLQGLTQQLMDGRISRREFTRRAIVLGVSASVIGSVLVAQGASAHPASASAPALATLASEKVTFRVLVPSNGGVTDYKTNDFTKWYEAKTNVHIDWQVVPFDSAQDKLNIVLASGEYPDIIMNFNQANSLTPTQQQLYGAQGVFIALNALIDKYGVNTKKVFRAYPDAKDAVTATDGKIYSLPYVDDCYHCSMDKKLWFNRKWLDKLGLKMPTTTAEFEQVLKAFKTRDPNGDGKADEIPLTGCPTSWNTTFDPYFMNSFIFNPGPPWVIANKGKIEAIYVTPQWKQGLAFLHRLYAEGLIDPQSFTQSPDQLTRLGNNPGPNLVGACPGGTQGVFVNMTEGLAGRWLDYIALPPLKGPNGVRIAAWDPHLPIATGSFVITKACKRPDIAVRWADGLYERETTMRANYGVLGRDWRWARQGEVGINGKPAIWTPLPSNAKNTSWSQTGPSYRPSWLRLGQAVTDARDKNIEVLLYEQTRKNYAPYRQPAGMWLPVLFFSQDQANQIAQMESTITQYVTQVFASFVTGKTDLTRGWDRYVSTLRGMGLPTYLQIYQAAYDAKYKK